MSDFTHDSFHHLFSERILNTPRSFIREMLTVTQNSDIISFAGGLPEPSLFPVEEIALAAQTALSEEGSRALQYSTTEGYTALRQWIVDDYERRGMHTRVDEIIITAGSQQALDLIARPSSTRERPYFLSVRPIWGRFRPLLSQHLRFARRRFNPMGPSSRLWREV